MVDDLRVTGAEELAQVTARLKAAGEGELRKELLRGLRNAAKPMVTAARESARDTLPHRGGLNEVVAGSRFAVRTRTSGRNPGVRVVALSSHNLRLMDRGVVRHPVFGNRDVWRTTRVRPGWFSGRLEREAPEIRQQLVRVMDGVAERITRG